MFFELIKTVTCLTAQIGAGKIVGNILNAHIPENVSKAQKIVYSLGAAALVAAAGVAASNSVAQTFDSTKKLVDIVTGKDEKEAEVTPIAENKEE